MIRRSLLLFAVASCASPAPAPRPAPAPAASSPPALPPPPPRAAPVTVSAPLPPAPVMGAGSPTKPALGATVLAVEYVNLGASSARLFDIDAEGLGWYRSGSDTSDGTTGPVTAKSLERLRETFTRARFCSIRPPDEEPMTFTIVRIDLANMKCSVKMAPEAWRKRHPDVVRTLKALEEEVCNGPCTLKSPF